MCFALLIILLLRSLPHGFSLVLLRYAFSPLLDNPEDEDDEEEQFVSDAFGLKLRGSNNSTSPKPKSSTTEVNYFSSFLVLFVSKYFFLSTIP